MAIASPIDNSDGVLSISVHVNGLPIKDTYPMVSITVNHQVNHISTAELTFLDGSVEAADFPISASDDLAPGSKIEVLAGYGSEMSSRIFKGTIVKQGIRVDDISGGLLTITCKYWSVIKNRSNNKLNDKPALRIAYGDSIIALNAEFNAENTSPIIKGSVTFQGSSKVIPGKIIELTGLGSRFNGNKLISAVTHILEDGNWQTIVDFED